MQNRIQQEMNRAARRGVGQAMPARAGAVGGPVEGAGAGGATALRMVPLSGATNAGSLQISTERKRRFFMLENLEEPAVAPASPRNIWWNIGQDAGYRKGNKIAPGSAIILDVSAPDGFITVAGEVGGVLTAGIYYTLTEA